MGQTIQINKTSVVDQMLIIDTDRTLGGQDGESFARSMPEEAVKTIPHKLAEALFGLDPGIDNVYVMSNAVSIRRPEGWDETSESAVTSEVSDFFRFYR